MKIVDTIIQNCYCNTFTSNTHLPDVSDIQVKARSAIVLASVFYIPLYMVGVTSLAIGKLTILNPIMDPDRYNSLWG